MRAGASLLRGGRLLLRPDRLLRSFFEQVLDIWAFYRARIRGGSVLVQECFAILGLAVGVALLFASQVSSTSLDRSVSQLNRQVVGDGARFQIDARGPGGFNEALFKTIRRLPGVLSAMPVVEQSINVIAGDRQESVELLGADPQYVHIGGPLVREFSGRQLAAMHALALPAPIAANIGAHSLQTIRVQVGGNTRLALLGAVLQGSEVGALASNPVALAPIAYAQELTNMRGRLTRVFVQPAPGDSAQVHSELARFGAERNLTLAPAMYDANLFAQAAYPESQGELLFSAISALVGFMLALNAMLITVPARRKMIEAVRFSGATRSTTVKILLFDAAVLAALGIVVGLALGELLSIEVFHSTPGYLASAFPVGSSRIVTWQSVVIASAAAVVAAVLGVLWPVRDLLRPPRTPEQHIKAPWGLLTGRLLLGSGCLSATTVILVLAPQAAIVGVALLIVALVCLLPPLFDGAVVAFERLQRPLYSASTKLAVAELQTPGTRIRALAIAATGAVAVFGTVSIGGAQSNLQHGLDASAHAIDASANVWVLPGGESSILATLPFQGVAPSRLAGLPGVRTVGVYRGGFLDWGDRRLWIQAQPSESYAPVPAGQLISGSLPQARARIRSGGWAVVSEDVAREHGLRVGETFTLPAPHPIQLRVAALATNLGWPPGAIVMSSADYAHAWQSTSPSAYEVQTAPGTSPEQARAAIQHVLGRHTGLVVETRGERQRRLYALAAQGLSRLTQIRLLVLLAAILATAGAMGAMLWQRRDLVAWVKCQGYGRGVLWRWLSVECAAMLGSGCLIGAAFGVYGQLLLSHTLVIVTGFPVYLHFAALVAISSFALVTVVAVAVVSLAGYLVVRVPARTASPAY